MYLAVNLRDKYKNLLTKKNLNKTLLAKIIKLLLQYASKF